MKSNKQCFMAVYRKELGIVGVVSKEARRHGGAWECDKHCWGSSRETQFLVSTLVKKVADLEEI